VQYEPVAEKDSKEKENLPFRASETRRVLRVLFKRRVVIICSIIILAFIILAIFAPLISPYDPDKQNLKATMEQPSRTHLLGTDWFGRDVLSRLIYGTRISLMIGIVAVGIASFIGLLLGLLAGYYGRWTNNIIMRIMDGMMALPALVLAMAIAVALGGGLRNITLSLGISMVPGYCRLVCGQGLTIKENEFITAARSLGASDMRIIFRHILPNIFPVLLVLITLNIGTMILAEAGLSFLGVGVQPPTATWGSMVNGGYLYLLTNPILSFSPGVAVALVVISFNMVGDGLRDALDPRLRGTL
jgi:ABC-type dipeptide/oligopeptide/nickel transport system permease subunit